MLNIQNIDRIRGYKQRELLLRSGWLYVGLPERMETPNQVLVDITALFQSKRRF